MQPWESALTILPSDPPWDYRCLAGDESRSHCVVPSLTPLEWSIRMVFHSRHQACFKLIWIESTSGVVWSFCRISLWAKFAYEVTSGRHALWSQSWQGFGSGVGMCRRRGPQLSQRYKSSKNPTGYKAISYLVCL